MIRPAIHSGQFIRRRILQPRRPSLEVALFRQAGGCSRGLAVVGPGRCQVAGHLLQMRSHRVEVGGARPSDRRCPAASSMLSPAAGPRAIATATAWFSLTIGVGERRSSSSYNATICGQSVSCAVERLVVDRGDRGLQLVRDPAATRSACGRSSPHPRRCSRNSTAGRSCSASGTNEPSAVVRAGRRASVSSISASSPATSPSSGSKPEDHACQPDRFPGEVGAGQVRTGTGRVALVEDEVQHLQYRRHPGRPSRQSVASGIRCRSP